MVPRAESFRECAREYEAGCRGTSLSSRPWWRCGWPSAVRAVGRVRPRHRRPAPRGFPPAWSPWGTSSRWGLPAGPWSGLRPGDVRSGPGERDHGRPRDRDGPGRDRAGGKLDSGSRSRHAAGPRPRRRTSRHHLRCDRDRPSGGVRHRDPVQQRGRHSGPANGLPRCRSPVAGRAPGRGARCGGGPIGGVLRVERSTGRDGGRSAHPGRHRGHRRRGRRARVGGALSGPFGVEPADPRADAIRSCGSRQPRGPGARWTM